MKTPIASFPQLVDGKLQLVTRELPKRKGKK